MLVVRDSFHLGNVVLNVGDALTPAQEKELTDKIALVEDAAKPNFKAPPNFDIQQANIAADDARMKLSYCIRVADRPVQPVATTTPSPSTTTPAPSHP